MHVKVERHASGKARLRKYVEVEEVEQTVLAATRRSRSSASR